MGNVSIFEYPKDKTIWIKIELTGKKLAETPDSFRVGGFYCKKNRVFFLTTRGSRREPSLREKIQSTDILHKPSPKRLFPPVDMAVFYYT
jgi:hypothetical protein